MIPYGLTKKEYDAIPDSHVHLTDGLDFIHKMPSLGVKRLEEYLKDGWKICLKDGSEASAAEQKEIKAFVKKVEINIDKREKKRLTDLKAQQDKTKVSQKALDEANAERDAAIKQAEADRARAVDAEAEISTLRSELANAESDVERQPDKDAESEGGDSKGKDGY